MTLVKLINGYIYDTENFGYYNSDNRIAYFRNPISTSNGTTYGLRVTPEEADCIMEMKNKQPSFPEAVKGLSDEIHQFLGTVYGDTRKI